MMARVRCYSICDCWMVIRHRKVVDYSNETCIAINCLFRWHSVLVLQLTVFSCRTYSFKKHERINAFFNNFDDFLCEEAMWQISESIKPRGGKKAQ